MKSTIVGSSGYEANVTSDGKLEVSTNLGTVTVTDITIKDPTTGTNKLKVNADGSVNTTLTGSNVEQTIGSAIPSKANLLGISDGTNIQALVGNAPLTILASAARTSNASSSATSNYVAKGIFLFLNVTAASGTGGLTIELRGVDPVSGTYVKFFIATTAITAVGVYGYEISPGSVKAGTAGTLRVVERAQNVIPSRWYIAVIHGDASSYTYSIGGHYNL